MCWLFPLVEDVGSFAAPNGDDLKQGPRKACLPSALRPPPLPTKKKEEIKDKEGALCWLPPPF
jgi:hypothetical protein